MSAEETRRSVELQSMYAVLPAFRAVYRQIEYKYADQLSENVDRPYASNLFRAMGRDELCDYIRFHELAEKLERGVLG
jgi:hypothetical protein